MKTHSSSKRLALGTVQFGVDYGISNTRGKVPREEVFEILEYASSNGIDTLDTAYNYGESEKVIGEFLKYHGDLFKIISKLPGGKDSSQIEELLDKSLDNLNCQSVYGYLFHDFNSFKENPSLLSKVLQLKKKGKISKVGFSLYYPKELEFLLDNHISVDLIQVPYNIFDQRFGEYFEKVQELGIEIHTRSVFLQGLFFLKPEDLQKNFAQIRPQILLLNRISEESKISISSLCINYAISNPYIGKVIIGVDNISNLKENLASLEDISKVKGFIKELEDLRVDDEQIILPTNWR